MQHAKGKTRSRDAPHRGPLINISTKILLFLFDNDLLAARDNHTLLRILLPPTQHNPGKRPVILLVNDDLLILGFGLSGQESQGQAL